MYRSTIGLRYDRNDNICVEYTRYAGITRISSKNLN